MLDCIASFENLIFAGNNWGMKTYKILALLILLLPPFYIFSQSNKEPKTYTITGLIKDINDVPVLYASILIEERQQNIATNDKGEFLFSLPTGEYTIVIQHVGYELKSQRINVRKDERIEFILEPRMRTLPTIIVTRKKEDPAYRIMRQAIAKAPYHRNQLSYYKAEVYGKSIMKVIAIPKLVSKAMKMSEDVDVDLKKGDVFVRENVSTVTCRGDSISQRVKSIRNSFPDFIDISDLDQFGLFNIYSERRTYISPLSKQALSVYKFELVDAIRDKNDQIIYQIAFTPKNKNPYAYRGTVYIVDGSWHVQHFDISLNTNMSVGKATINMKQNFGMLAENIWVPTTSYISVWAKVMGVEGEISLVTSIKYLDFTPNKKLIPEKKESQVVKKSTPKPTSPKLEKIEEKINTLAEKEDLTNRDAVKLISLIEEKTKEEEKLDTVKEKKSYEIKSTRSFEVDSLAEKTDSTYWEENRQIPLDEEEIHSFEEKAIRDSVKKLTFSDVVSKAKNQESKNHRFNYGVDKLAEYFDFNPVDAVKLKPGFYLRYNFKDTTSIRLNAGAGYSFGQKKFIFSSQLSYDYLPEKRAGIALAGGKDNSDFNLETGIGSLGNALGTLFFKNNAKLYYDRAFIELKHAIEPFNGFNTFFSFAYEWRAPLENSTEYAFFFRKKRDYPPNIPDNQYVANDPTLVDAGKGAIMQLRIEYTPKTYYSYYNRRKINRSSRYPTFSFLWKKGILGLLGSTTQFDYLELNVNQRIRPNIRHAYYYDVTGGIFPGKGKMHFSEFKHSQVYVFPLTLGPLFTTFHTQDVYKFATNEWYVSAFFRYEGLYVLLKFIPGLNKTTMKENLYFSYLKTPISGHYTELGYSLDQIFMFFKVGFFVGFEDLKYQGWNVKLSVDLP